MDVAEAMDLVERFAAEGRRAETRKTAGLLVRAAPGLRSALEALLPGVPAWTFPEPPSPFRAEWEARPAPADADGCVGTVVIPVRNGAGLLRGAVASVLASVDHYRQTASAARHRVRIVVADDGSDDDPAAALRGLPGRGAELIVVRQTPSRGAGAARNMGVRAAAGPLVWFLDADDEMLPHHLATCVDLFRAVPEAGLVKTGLVLDHEISDDWHAPLEHTTVINACVRRDCHDAVGGYPEHPECRVSGGEDAYYFGLLSARFALVHTALPTVRYTARPGNTFMRQLVRFRRPWRESADDDSFLGNEAKAVLPRLRALFQAHLARLGGPLPIPPRAVNTIRPQAADIGPSAD